jgi:hypothetical protein
MDDKRMEVNVLEGEQRDSTPRQTAAFPRRWRSLKGLTIAVALASAIAPQTADAHWSRVATGPSSTSPFYACPHLADRASCSLIEDPTRGSRSRGPVKAGAITAGPEMEVSPALSGNGVEGGYSPEDLRNAYDLPAGSAGAGQTVAVVDAFDDPDAESDLNSYRARYAIPACTEAEGCFRKVDETGGRSYPLAEATWAHEISVDLDMVSAICPNCHILLVEARTDEDTRVAAAESEAVRLGATEISDSFAESEAPKDSSAYDQPIPIAAAGGDHGFGVVWPAANPHVIAVGGTTLRPGGGSWTESAWSETGSGCSQEPKPAWQTDGGCAGRTANDVAAVADPNTPVSVYDSFKTGSSPWQLAGGTSVATPIIAAAMALASPYTRSFEGADALYLEQANGVHGFNDILAGSNGNCHSYLCEAEPGYDGPTGLGSLHGTPEVPPPKSVTTRATAIGFSEATLEASVNPHGVALSRCALEYGPSTSYGTSVPCSPAPDSGTSSVAVSAKVTGLTPGTGYHFRIAIGYQGGAEAGEDATFTTLGHAPAVLAGAASPTSASSASLTATVNPNGLAVVQCEFEYGTTTAYEKKATCAPAPAGGQTPVPVSASATGLQTNVMYHFRVVAANAAGTSRSIDQTFTLLPKAPIVATQPASAITQTSATLNATVDPGGTPVTACEFEFASAESYLPCAQVPGSGESPVAVSAPVHGLQPGASYNYRLVVVSEFGTVYGAIQTLSTESGPVLPVTLPPSEPIHTVEPAPVSPPPPPAVPPCQAELTRTTLAVSPTGAFTVALRCAAASAAGTGTITLQTLNAVRAGSHSAPKLTIAVGAFAVGAGRVTGLTLHLSTHARGLLARSHSLLAHATILTRAANGSTLLGRTIVRLRARTTRPPTTVAT